MAVSAVLNGAGGRKITVTQEKADRIRKVALEMRYQPNRAASNFRRGRTDQIAVVFQNFGRFTMRSPYRGEVMNGVMEAIFPHGYTLSLCPKLMIGDNVGSVSDGRFDGVLWCRPDLSDVSAAALQASSVPVVMMHAPPGTVLGLSTFCADNDGAMRRIVDHLVSLGHERLAYLIDPVSEHSVEGLARAEALKTSARRAGLPEPEVIVLASDHSILARYSKPDRPHTALVCFSDELASFVLASCESLGVKVPHHVSVTGFDSSPICETTRPRLTSVNQPVERMAFEATTHLLSLIRGAEDGVTPSTATSTMYDCTLDVRESTGPPNRDLVS
jgi:LacI family transcriptional regulator